MATMTWGGNWANAVRGGVDTRFEAETGIGVVQDQSNPLQRITKLKVGLDDQVYDLVNLPHTLIGLAVKQGVVESLDPQSGRLTNLADVYPGFVREHWVAQMYTAVGIGYNPERISTPPTSFADLFNEEYRGHIVLPDINHSIGLYLVLLGAIASGKDLYDTEAGLEGLKRLVDLRPVWSANDFNPMYETGEANVGLMYKNQAYTLLDKGVPVKWVYPKKGAFSLSWGWSIAKNTKNLPWAKHYLNLPLDPQGQTHFTDYNNYAGSNRKMSDHLSPEKRERVTFSEAELASLIEPDHDFLDERRDEWTKRWNVIVAGS